MSAAHKSQLSGVVVATVLDTFNQMLRQNVTVMQVRAPRGPGPDAAVYACVKLDQEQLSAQFYFSFDRSLLLLTADCFYDQDKARRAEVQEDIACAVANIVGGQVKTFLNRQGYDFEMGLPFIVEPPEAQKPNEKAETDVIQVHFSFDRSGDNGVVVNYTLEETTGMKGAKKQ